MRMIRKLTLGLLTLFFMLGMGVTAYAAGGTITIANSVAGQKYDAYRVFDYVPKDEANADKGGIYKEAPKFSGLRNYTYTDDGDSVLMSSFFTVGENDILDISGLGTEQDRDLFGRAVLAYAKANGIANDGSTLASEDGVATIAVSEYGWYVIESSLGNKVMYVTTTPNASIEERNSSVPTVDLEVKDAANPLTIYSDKTGNDAQIGDTVSFRITAELKKGGKNYAIVDTMTSGLTLVPVQDDDVSFSNVHLAFSIDNDYVDGSGYKGFKVMFEGEPKGDTTVTVEYQAVVNKDAVIASDNNISEAFLIYGNVTETAHVTTETNTYPLQIKKIATGDPNEKILPGAEFKLIRKLDASAILFTKISDTEYRVDPEGTADCIVTVEDAPITVSGLNAEDYILVETQAPQGYTLLDSSVTVDGTEYSHACNVTVSDSSKTGAVQVKKIENGLAVKINGSYTYNGSSQVPELTVMSDTSPLTPGTDYETEYQKKKTDGTWESSSVINAGTYRVKITGKSGTGYAGMVIYSAEFSVRPKDVTITAQDKKFVYDGKAHIWPEYDVEGLVGDDKIEAKITGFVMLPEEGQVVNKVESYEFTAGNPDNYTVETMDGKLTMSYGPVVTVTFDANNGSGKRSTQDFYKGVAEKLKKNEFTYAGHIFKSWNTKADGSGDKYDDKASVKLEEDMTLYAQWKENEKYSVTVETDKNGTASADPSSAPAGTKIKLTAKSKAGYKFKKWTSSDGVKFAKATSATTTFDMPEKNVTVKANFEKINITLIVTMKSNGKTKMDIAWKKIKEADGYDVFFEKCNSKNEKKEPKLIATIKNNKTTKYTVSKIQNSKNKKESLKAKTSYKAYVRPFVWKDSKKKNKIYIGKSPIMHAYTSGGSKSVTNAKSITIRNKEIKKDKVTIAKGKTLMLDVGINYVYSKKEPFPDGHVSTIRYLSTNKNIATASATGKNKAKNTVKITAKKKGKCTIYVYAHNGVNKAITVTVK